MRRCALQLVFAFSVAAAARAQSEPPAPPSTLLVAVDQRTVQSLNGAWHYIVDPYQTGLFSFHGAFNPNGFFKDEEVTPGSNSLLEYSFSRSPTLNVPGDWNTQAEALKLYEGAVWYERRFAFTPAAGHRAFLHIGAANYRSHAWINGQYVCAHEGGFTPFDCEITSAVKAGDNSVVIFVDDTRLADGVPTTNTDWYNYGGLTRDVSVVSVPDKFIDDFDLHLDRQTRTTIEGYVHVEGSRVDGTKVAVSIPELHLQTSGVADASGRVPFTIATKGLRLWTPEAPKLYHVELSAGADKLTDEIGFRTIETSGSRILLNGKPVVLHGISIHAEAPFRTGRVNTDADVATLLGWVKEMGGNYMRLAHYPHDERMTRAADRLGILVWSEVPVYWAEHFDDEKVFAKSQQQLHEMIRRDRDKASVILWSVANETPLNDVRTAFLKRSAAYVHQQDPGRLVTAALLVRGSGNTKFIDDPLGDALDVIGFNEYIGWYERTPADADTTTWKISYDKPLIVSEFGGEAKAGLHGTSDQRWTEEYQADLFRHQLIMLNKIPQLRGATPWLLMDFRSPRRQYPGLQDGFNRKGLISDQGQKKAAFFVLQEAYKNNGLGHAE